MGDIARNSDPETSHQAEQHMNESGGRQSMISKVAEMVAEHQDKTGRELAKIYNYPDTSVVLKRISDAHNRGLIRSTETRKCTVTGRQARTWFPTKDQQSQ